VRLIKGPVQLPYPPRACAVTNREDGDFIDFNVVIDRPEPTRLYLKTEIVEEAGRLCGMVPAKEVEELRERVEAWESSLEDTKATIALTNRLEQRLTEKVAA
jgi:hypothetical protein